MTATASSPVPLLSRITSNFKTKARPDHAGTDIGPPIPGQKGKRYTAVLPGTVTAVRYNAAPYHTGLAVIVDHGILTAGGTRDRIETYGGHLARASVKVGDRVAAGDDLGEIGTTGNSQHIHLHFGVRCNGVWIDPVKWLALRGVTIGRTAPLVPARRYTIRRGDTLGAIARRYRTTVAKLVARNGIRNANLIRPGQTLEL